MPKDNKLKTILLIGSGPIIIGQACEFDYSGSQALRSLREDGIKTILINSNPATIMTDPSMADHVYLLPLNTKSIVEILKKHPVNLKRIEEGKDPANSVWFWSPGNKPEMETLEDQYGVTGGVISAVDLIYGIGKYAGMKAIKVPGSTGLYDTNYEGKAKAAVDALKEVDLVYLHIEASDEAGHEGDEILKTKTIEYLDERVVKYIMAETAKMDEDVAIALLPDHPTPCEIRTHTHDAVPFLIYNPELEGDTVKEYNEESVKEGYFGLVHGNEFVKALLRIE